MHLTGNMRLIRKALRSRLCSLQMLVGDSFPAFCRSTPFEASTSPFGEVITLHQFSIVASLIAFFVHCPAALTSRSRLCSSQMLVGDRPFSRLLPLVLFYLQRTRTDQWGGEINDAWDGDEKIKEKKIEMLEMKCWKFKG